MIYRAISEYALTESHGLPPPRKEAVTSVKYLYEVWLSVVCKEETQHFALLTHRDDIQDLACSWGESPYLALRKQES